MKFALISLKSRSSEAILKEAEKKFEEAKLLDIRKIEIKFNKVIYVLYDGEPLNNYDCIYIRGSYKYSSLMYGLTELLKKKSYIPIDSNAHIIAHNKFLMHLHFSQEKLIKTPMTYYAPKITETKKFMKTLNYPIILKFPSGTHGKGVIFTESYASASSMIDALDVFKQPVLIQDYINIKSDIRVIVVGDEIVASMKRTSPNEEVRANIHNGGTATTYKPSTEIKNMAISAAKIIGAEICAVDIIDSDYGPMILEINTSPGLQMITEVSKINVAKKIVDYLFEKAKERTSNITKNTSEKVITNLGINKIDNSETNEFEVEAKIINNKIILPEFVTKISKIKKEETINIKLCDGNITINKAKED